jgi:hypothetical protein
VSDLSPSSCFAASYAEARARFLGAAAAAGARVASHPHPLAGPDGEPLFLDEARLGPADARRVLYLASGTHGIEGFCGSGIQTFLLRGGLAERLPAGVALLLVHGVNPWGFAWLRRVNEDNVDLNRNFLDHAAGHPANPDYDRLAPVVNPERFDEDALAAVRAATAAFAREHGPAALYRALSGGQYRHPRGVQYGGVEPAWSNRLLRALWARHSAGVELAACVDLHSGLGPNGIGLVLQTAPEASVGARLAKQWWPELLRAEPAAGSDAALVSGLMGPAFVAAHPRADALAVVLELGTREMDAVMTAVLADNWLHHHGERASERGRAITRSMREAFFDERDEWKEAVCRRAREVVDRALSGMAGSAQGERP